MNMAATKAKSKTNSKQRASVTINLRMKTSQRDLIDQAADAVGKNRSEYLLDVATQAAQETILNQRLLLFSDAQWEEFPAAMARPPLVNELFKKAMSRKSTWKQS